jgi:hypothetical protein
MPQLDDPLGDFVTGASRTMTLMRRAVAQADRPRGSVTCRPLVAGLRRDAKAPAQLTPIDPRLHGQLYELLSQLHPGNLRPLHLWHLRLEGQYSGQVLPMSPAQTRSQSTAEVHG